MLTTIAKIGFEIEGEFDSDFEDKLSSLGSIKSDGSVKSCSRSKCQNLETKEFASNVFSVTNWQEIQAVFNLFQLAYESDCYHYNESAGFHIHMSFNPSKPGDIFSTQFLGYFKEELAKKYPQELKQRGNNYYCKMIINEDEVAKGNGDRYRAVNLWPSFLKHGTVEFRIWPTNEPIKMLDYLRFTIECVNTFVVTPLKVNLSTVIENKGEITQEIYNARTSSRTYKTKTTTEKIAGLYSEMF